MGFAGQRLDREEVLAEVLRKFFHLWTLWRSGCIEPIRERWIALCAILHHPVTVTDRRGKPERIEGVAVDLDQDGALIVRGSDGRLHRIIEGRISK